MFLEKWAKLEGYCNHSLLLSDSRRDRKLKIEPVYCLPTAKKEIVLAVLIKFRPSENILNLVFPNRRIEIKNEILWERCEFARGRKLTDFGRIYGSLCKSVGSIEEIEKNVTNI